MKKLYQFGVGIIVGLINRHGSLATRDAFMAKIENTEAMQNGFDVGVEITSGKIVGAAIIGIALIALMGCATAPEKIVAASTATGCSRVPGDDVIALAKLEDKQRANVSADATTTILLGVPLSKIRGKDHADEIARLKACVALVS